MADIENRAFDVVSVLTGLFAAAYIGGAIYGLTAGAFDVEEYLTVIGAPALPLFGYWVRGKQ